MTTKISVPEILSGPCTSYWLKDAIVALSRRDPADAVADAELLLQVARQRLNEIQRAGYAKCPTCGKEPHVYPKANVASRLKEDGMRTKTLHTSGPWSMYFCKEGIEIAPDPAQAGNNLALVHGTREHRAWEEAQANARLIAAAPDMYRILSAILKHLRLNENVSRSALILDGEDEYLGKAIADVIAKAEGRR